MQHNYFNYPNDKLPTYGSVPYFAYRKLDDTKKEVLYCLDQIKSQIISCTEIYNNIEVANEKMNWWINEINAIKKEQNISSPQLKTLLKYFDKEILYKNLINDVTYAIENSSAEERDFIKHIGKSFFGIEMLKALYLNNFGFVNQAVIKQLNRNNEIVRAIFQMPKHFYNHIKYDENISPNMGHEAFREIANKWLDENYRTIHYKNIKALTTMNKIHYKMAKKFIKKIDNPFKEAIALSPITLLFYSI